MGKMKELFLTAKNKLFSKPCKRNKYKNREDAACAAQYLTKKLGGPTIVSQYCYKCCAYHLSHQIGFKVGRQT